MLAIAAPHDESGLPDHGEPSEGSHPIIIQACGRRSAAEEDGLSILLVEQKRRAGTEAGDHCPRDHKGRVVYSATPRESGGRTRTSVELSRHLTRGRRRGGGRSRRAALQAVSPPLVPPWRAARTLAAQPRRARPVRCRATRQSN